MTPPLTLLTPPLKTGHYRTFFAALFFATLPLCAQVRVLVQAPDGGISFQPMPIPPPGSTGQQGIPGPPGPKGDPGVAPAALSDSQKTQVDSMIQAQTLNVYLQVLNVMQNQIANAIAKLPAPVNGKDGAPGPPGKDAIAAAADDSHVQTLIDAALAKITAPPLPPIPQGQQIVEWDCVPDAKVPSIVTCRVFTAPATPPAPPSP